MIDWRCADELWFRFYPLMNFPFLMPLHLCRDKHWIVVAPIFILPLSLQCHSLCVCMCLCVHVCEPCLSAFISHYCCLSGILIHPLHLPSTSNFILEIGYWFILCQPQSHIQANHSSDRHCFLPVAAPICVSSLGCPSENMLRAWEGDESPLASSQLSCHASPPSLHALPLICPLSPPHHSTTLCYLHSPSCAMLQTFPRFTITWEVYKMSKWSLKCSFSYIKKWNL